ncbi:MAG TPA: hypothetical protein VHM25_13825, partial [Polyangiaceae bacterium]|nr:hypothetical protein [Polyangiaceae bacterium]
AFEPAGAVVAASDFLLQPVRPTLPATSSIAVRASARPKVRRGARPREGDCLEDSFVDDAR